MGNVQAYILAGGKSQRFGSDKSRARLGGTTLIDRTIRFVEKLDLPLTVVADRPERFSDLATPIITDEIPEHGPLSGLAAALNHCPSESWVFLISCDLKALEPHWLEQLTAEIGPKHQAIAFRDQAWQPFVALYHPAILATVRRNLAQSELSLQKLLDQVATQAVELPRDWISPPSINTPEDLDVLRSEEPSHAHRP